VLGAKGGTGCQLVAALAQAQDDISVCEIRADVRDPSSVHEGAFPDDDRVKIMAGDVADITTLEAAFVDAEGVFFAAAGRGWDNCIAVDYKGVGAVAELAKQCGVRRLLLVSSQLVHPDNRFSMVRGILNTINTGLFASVGMMDFKFAGEQLLRYSGQEYTIVRPGRLCDGPGGKAKVQVAQCNETFQAGGQTQRADLAAVCLRAIVSLACANTTFELDSEVPGEEPMHISDQLFEKLRQKWGEDWEHVGSVEDAVDAKHAHRCC